MSIGDYSEEEEEYEYSNTDYAYRGKYSNARESFSTVDNIDEPISDPNENIRYLKEKLNLAAQAGLSLLKDNEEMKEKLSKSGSAYAKLMEELSAERHKNRQQATTLMMEYEAKIQEMQKEADEAKTLTVNEILNSRHYIKLSEKHESSLLKIKDFELRVAHLENMRSSNRSTNDCAADLEEAQERSESIARREQTLLSRINELESIKETHETFINDLQNKLGEFESSSTSVDIQTENDSLKKNVEKLKEQLEAKDQEIEKEHELANRAIDECKRLSIQILLSTEEMSPLKNKISKLENNTIENYNSQSIRTDEDNSKIASFFNKIVNRFMQ